MDYYLKMQNTYGLPLDNRETYSKLDWIMWTATLTGERKDFDALLAPVFKFLNEGSDRSPMTDWYQTKSGKKVGFTARPVVGGVFARVLYDKTLWKKYASMDMTKGKNWAPMPDYVKPITKALAPTGDDSDSAQWSYTFDKPSDNWSKADFDDAAWRRGPAGFGTRGTPNTKVRTVWNTQDIWLRRTITLPDPLPAHLAVISHHDEDLEVFVNGVLVGTASGFNDEFEKLAPTPNAKSAYKLGSNVVAVHCHQITGGQYVDLTISSIELGKK